MCAAVKEISETIGTFVTTGSPLIDKPVSITKEYNLIINLYKNGKIYEAYKLAPETKFYGGLHFLIKGKRKDIFNFCKQYRLP